MIKKEIVKVSLSGISFAMEDDAYARLDTYLKQLERCYATNSDVREILDDIESRIVELVLSKQSTSDLIGAPLVESIIDQLGYPEEMPTHSVSASATEAERSESRFPRRLYRNSQGAKLGGVCSGIAAYFNIDMVFVRLMFCVPLLISICGWALMDHRSGGLWGSILWIDIVIYLIMWIIIPMARTPRQRLEMEGEKVTVESIKRNFERDAEQIAQPKSLKVANVMGELISIVGRIIIFFIKTVSIFVGIVSIFFGVILLVVLLRLVFDLGGNMEIFRHFTDWAPHMSILEEVIPKAYLIGLSLSIVAIIFAPLVAFVWLLIHTILGKKGGRKILIWLGMIWVLGLISLGVFATFAITSSAEHQDLIESHLEEYYDSGSVTMTDPVIESDSTRTDSVTITVRTAE